jgi:lysozyme
MNFANKTKKDIKRIQSALKADGFDPGPIDGIAGPLTKAAASRWEAERSTWARGIDVSSYQTSIDWQKVAADGVSFMIARASVSIYPDRLFTSHIRGAKAAGLLVGAYHFFAPWRSVTSQVELIISQLNNDLELPLVLDVEALAPKQKKGQPVPTPVSKKQLIQRTASCLQMLHLRLGRKPTLYTYSAFSEQFRFGAIFGNEYNLHIADYREGPPTVSAGWKGYNFHQYLGNDGRQTGVAGPCDLNVFRGSIGQLRSFCGII